MNIRFGNVFYGWGAAIKSFLVELPSWTWKKWVANILRVIGWAIVLGLGVMVGWFVYIVIKAHWFFFYGLILFMLGGAVLLLGCLGLIAIAVWVENNK